MPRGTRRRNKKRMSAEDRARRSVTKNFRWSASAVGFGRTKERNRNHPITKMKRRNQAKGAIKKHGGAITRNPVGGRRTQRGGRDNGTTEHFHPYSPGVQQHWKQYSGLCQPWSPTP